jgi:2-keto-4-pentenoate hydratase/2-oxohepta-3-ene-1,7-dioic acid hydratase in catechol pathway
VDLEKASNKKFSSDPMDAYSKWDQLREFAESLRDDGNEISISELDSPSPRPRQLIAIGLNYRRHAIEFGLEIPSSPLTFTKFPSSIGAPNAHVPLQNDCTDWEAEFVVVVGSGGRNIPAAKAWDHLAGACVGQDISDRIGQFATNPPQFSLGKSHQNHTVFGPWVVDARDLASRDCLNITCTVSGREVQNSNTSDLIFSVSEIIEYLSSILELYPGDVIYTGTPNGVGTSRKPPEYLKKDDVIVSTIESIGTITNVCI